MCKIVKLTTRDKNYDVSLENTTFGGDNDKKSTSSIPPPFPGSIHIDNPTIDSILCPLKGIIRNYDFNPSARSTENYNIVEDLAQAP
jgi:hypothetical protein